MTKVRRFFPVISWALVILFLSVTPSSELPDTDIKFADKAAHFVVYAVLSFLLVLNYATHRQHHKLNWVNWLALFSISLFYGIFIEILQEYFIPSRFGEWQDALANGIGSFFGLVVGKLRLK